MFWVEKERKLRSSGSGDSKWEKELASFGVRADQSSAATISSGNTGLELPRKLELIL